MNEHQRQDLLKYLDRLIQNADDEEVEILDDMRYALKKWDLQGPVPYVKEFLARGIDLESTSFLPAELEKVEEPISPALSADAVQHLLKALQERLRVTPSESSQYEWLKEVRSEVRNWSEAGCQGPLPHAEDLRAWGIDLEALSASVTETTPAAAKIVQDVPAPDAMLVTEYETAHSLIEGQPYQAIQRLLSLQGRAQGDLSERVTADLGEARVTLQRRTEALLIAARRVKQEQPKDIAAQAEAWRAVTTLNPESLLAQEALQILQQRVRQELENEMRQLEQKAHHAASRDDLPELNAVFASIEALAARGTLPGDLVESVEQLAKEVLGLRTATRERLGVASTKQVEGDLRESYRLARESFERGIRQLVDTGGVLGPVDADVETVDFFRVVSSEFLAATRKKVDERLSSARAVKSGAPDAALVHLAEAQGWLTDEVWTTDHRRALLPQLEEVEHEVEDVKRLLKQFEAAREQVTQARSIGLPAQERLRLLNVAQQRYPTYPNIDTYLEEARDNLAGELAGMVEAQVVEARRLMLAEQFAEALESLRQARDDALRDVPKPKTGSPLQHALERVAQEETSVAVAERALHNLETLLEQVNLKLQAYIDDRTNLSLLNEARALLEQVPEEQRQHPQTQMVRGHIANEQGEAENYTSGKAAYARADWAGARDYFNKVTSAFAQYAEAQQLSKRAVAALAAAEAEKAENEKRWNDALNNYRQAVHLFEEAGDDSLTAAIAVMCRKAKQSIEETDQQFRSPLEYAQELLMQAQQSLPSMKASLRDRLDPIAEFKVIIETLEPLTQKPSALSEDIKKTLRETREMWRNAYLPALQQAMADAALGSVMLDVACQRAEELKAAGLLYSQEAEQLYYQLRGKQLDQEYLRLIGADSPDWAVIEKNRLARLDLSVAEKSEDHQKQWNAARDKRLKGEIQTRLEQENGVIAAQHFLGDQVRSGKVRADDIWLRQWLELCWQARDWGEAELVAQRLADLASEPATRRVQAALWQGVTRAAQAYAEDDIEGAQSRLEAVRMQVSDPVLDEIEALLEEQTFERLIATAAQDRRALEQPGVKVTPEHYFRVARAYGQALQLKPDDPVATQGLQAISSRIEPVLKQRCEEANTTRISKQDLDGACAVATRLLGDLKALEAIVEHLTLSPSGKSELEKALNAQQSKKSRWDKAAGQLKLFEEMVKESLACPTAPRLDDLRYSGGWDFSAARDLLKPIRTEATKERDLGLQELIDAETRRLGGYEESASQLMEQVRVLLGAVLEEKFEAVVSAANSLEILWKQVTGQDSAWDGLEVVISYLYRYPTREVHGVREHREQALKQQANLQAWEQYEKEVSGAYEALLAAEKDLEDDFEMLKYSLALRDIQAQCEAWERDCDGFLKRLEQRAPQEPPLSTRAEAVRAKAAVETRKAHLNSEGGARARIAALKFAAQEGQATFEPLLVRFRNFFNGLPPRVKNRRQQPRQEDRDLARKLYEECCKYDPMNAELKRLRKQLEDLGMNFSAS